MSVPPADDDAPGHLVILASRKLRCARVSLVGTLDLVSASCLTNWARQFSAGPLRAVRMDASGLRFVDTAGIRALAEVCGLLDRRCSSFALTALPPAACRLVILTGIDVPGRRCGSSTACYDAALPSQECAYY